MKKLLTSCLLLLGYFAVFSQSNTNSDCTNAIEVIQSDPRIGYTAPNNFLNKYAWYYFEAKTDKAILFKRGDDYSQLFKSCDEAAECSVFRSTSTTDSLKNITIYTGLTIGTKYYFALYAPDYFRPSFAISPFKEADNFTCINATEVNQSTDRTVTHVNFANILPDIHTSYKTAWYKFKPTTKNVKINAQAVDLKLFTSCNNDSAQIKGQFMHIYDDSLSSHYSFFNLDTTTEYSIALKEFNNSNIYKFAISDLAVPANIDSAHAQVIQEDIYITEDIRGAYNSNTNSNEVWFKFVPAQASVSIIAKVGEIKNIFLYNKKTGEKLLGTHNYFTAPLNGQSKITFNLSDGQEFYIQVQGYNVINFVIHSNLAPQHDECNHAIPVSDHLTYTGNTYGATQSVGNNLSDVWYEYKAAYSNIKISYDACSIILFDSCGGKLITAQEGRFGSYYRNLVVGKNYKLLVQQPLVVWDAIQFTFNITPYDLALNDNCETARTITVSDAIIYKDSCDFALSSLSYNMPEVWYEFEAITASIKITTTAYNILLFDSCGAISRNSSFQNGIAYYDNLTIGKKYKLAVINRHGFTFTIAPYTLPTNNECIEDYFSNSSQFPKGRKNIPENNCSTGIDNNKTVELFLKICKDALQIPQYIGRLLTIQSSNKKLVITAELLDSTGVDTYKHIACYNLTNGNPGSYSTLIRRNDLFNHKVIRLEISDTSSIQSNFEFRISLMPIHVVAVDDSILSENESYAYPNPFTDSFEIII